MTIKDDEPAPAQDTASVLFGMDGVAVTEAERGADGRLTVWARITLPAVRPDPALSAEDFFQRFLAVRERSASRPPLDHELCYRVADLVYQLVVSGTLTLSESPRMPLPLVHSARKTGGAAVAGEESERRQLASLVVAAQGGDALAMDQLIEQLTPFVAQLCGSIALQEGADAAQETLLAVFRGIRSLRDPDALYGWVKRIAVREAVRVAERARRTMPAELVDLPTRGDVELAADVGDVLARLSPQHRAVLVLRDMYGHDEREVSQWLAVPQATLRTRLFRARRRFSKEWQQ